MLTDVCHVSQHCRNVVRYEEEADGITREVLIGIRSTFITPFDRGDIKDLITSLDDAIDEMQKTAKAIVRFELTTFEPDMRTMADAIVRMSRLALRSVAPGSYANATDAARVVCLIWAPMRTCVGRKGSSNQLG